MWIRISRCRIMQASSHPSCRFFLIEDKHKRRAYKWKRDSSYRLIKRPCSLLSSSPWGLHGHVGYRPYCGHSSIITRPTIASLSADTPFSFTNQQHILIALLFSFAVYGPLLGGFVATYMAHGKPGVRKLLSRMGRWRIAGKWYGTAVLLILVITLLPLTLGLLLGFAAFKPGQPSFALATLATFLFLLIYQMLTSGLGEEPGWRGYLLPTLQASYGSPSRRRCYTCFDRANDVLDWDSVPLCLDV